MSWVGPSECRLTTGDYHEHQENLDRAFRGHRARCDRRYTHRSSERLGRLRWRIQDRPTWAAFWACAWASVRLCVFAAFASALRTTPDGALRRLRDQGSSDGEAGPSNPPLHDALSVIWWELCILRSGAGAWGASSIRSDKLGFYHVQPTVRKSGVEIPKCGTSRMWPIS
jgi:hypothetical protein